MLEDQTKNHTILATNIMAGKKNDKGKEKVKDGEKDGAAKKKGGDGKLKAATSINVRHILVRTPRANSKENCLLGRGMHRDQANVQIPV